MGANTGNAISPQLMHAFKPDQAQRLRPSMLKQKNLMELIEGVDEKKWAKMFVHNCLS